MANTYTQLYTQYVFAVKGRENLIREQIREELEKIMCGIITNHKCKTYAIYCNPDHTHILVGMHPTVAPAKLMEQVKSGSSNWLNNKKYIQGKFSWQDGYGAFTYSKSHIDNVVKYILKQPEHHKKLTFKEEYLSFLKKFEVNYDSKYLFEWYENVQISGLRPSNIIRVEENKSQIIIYQTENGETKPDVRFQDETVLQN